MSFKVDLFRKIPILERIAKMRSLQFLLIFPNFLVFWLLMLAAIFGHPLGNVNASIVFIWILWWALLIMFLVPVTGRAWCAMCPLAGPGEWLQRGTIAGYKDAKARGLNKVWPKRLRNIWAQNFGFLFLALFSALLVTRPGVTVLVIGGLWVMATVLMLIYRRRAFCVYLCPVSGFQGLYAMIAPLARRGRPKGEWTPKSGSTPKGYPCPWFENPPKSDRNNYCGLCMECVKMYEGQIGLYVRPVGGDDKLHGLDEAWKAFIMLFLAASYSIVLLGPFAFLKDWANVSWSKEWLGFLVVSSITLMSALVLMPVMFGACLKLAKRTLRSEKVSYKTLFIRAAYGLVPLGLVAWIAFSIPLVLVNGSYILQVLSDPFGWGWNLFGTKHVPWTPLVPASIPLIQAVLLIAGLGFSIVKTYDAIRDLFEDRAAAAKATVFPSIFLIGITVIFLTLFVG